MKIPFDIAVKMELLDIKKKVDEIKVKSKLLNRFCESKDKSIYVNANDLESVMDLIKNGYMIIRNDMSIKAANNAVLQSLCN